MASYERPARPPRPTTRSAARSSYPEPDPRTRQQGERPGPLGGREGGPTHASVGSPRPGYDDPYGFGDADLYGDPGDGPSSAFPGEPPRRRGSGGRGGGSDESPRRRKRSILWRMRRVLFIVGLVMMVGVAAFVAKMADAELPPLRQLQQSSLICAADVPSGCTAQNALAQLNVTENREIVPYKKIPPILVQAVIDSEDAHFMTHKGIDPVSISRALYWDLLSGRTVQGGSTITQQYVKNRFLDQEQTVTRKLKEAMLAIKVEQKYSKEQILEGYLNTIFFGRNSYGIEAATQAYFGKDVAQVKELKEVAYLAGVIRSPNKADASVKPAEAKYQRKKVLISMLQQGHITQEQFDATVNLPFDYVKPKAKVAKTAMLKLADKGGGYISANIATALERRPEKYGLTAKQVALGGLRIYTSIDPKLQAAAWDAIYNPAVNTDHHLDRPDLPLGALVSIDNNGNIKAMVGGRSDGTGANFAVTGRPVGSAFKPVVLAEALTENYSLDSMLDSPDRADIPSVPGCGEWHPHNVSESGQLGARISLVTATQHSVNTAYANLIYALAQKNGNSTDKVVKMARSLGMEGAINNCPSMVLGTNNSSPLEMAEMYSTFANEGVHKQSHMISKIEQVDQEGNVNVLYEAPTDATRVLSSSVAHRVTNTLEKVISPDGTGHNAQLGKPAAGKTGTTGDNKDAWFVGYTPKLTTAVWMGFEKATDWVNPDCQEAARASTINDAIDIYSRFESKTFAAKVFGHPEACPVEIAKMGSKGGGKPVYDIPQVIGGSIPAEIWRLYMSKATEGQSDQFTEPTPEELREGEVIGGDGGFGDGSTTTLPGDGGTTVPQGTIPPTTPPWTKPGHGRTTTTSTPSTTGSTVPSTTSTTCPPWIPGGGGGGGGCRGGGGN